MCVCVRSEHTLSMCQALGVKPWIKGSGRQQICLRFLIVSAQTVECVKRQVRPVRQRSLPKTTECWEIQEEAGSCFPSLTCGHGGRQGGTELWKYQIRRWEVRGQEGKKTCVPALMESEGHETFSVHKHTRLKDIPGFYWSLLYLWLRIPINRSLDSSAH